MRFSIPKLRVGLLQATLRFGAPLRSALLPKVAPSASLTQRSAGFRITFLENLEKISINENQ